MGGKHKKNLRKEKAKVQLKGSKLAKGTNITKADFKVRKIILKTQLNDTGATRKNSIKECITKLKHNNAGIRVDTMKSIKEILTNFPEDIYPKYFGDLLQTCVQLSLELEKDVRRESFRTLALLFGSVEETLVEPFFHVLSSYLRCAMTHLNQGIQEDSLLLLDLMLEHTPNLVAKNHEKIFEYFLDLISKMRSESKPGRTLSVNLGKKTTNVKWRCRVLERLLSILRCINVSASGEGDSRQSVEMDLSDKFNPGEYEEAIYVNLKRNYVEGKNSLAFLFQTDYGSTMDGDKDQQAVRKCNELIIPLLNESWMETRPESFERGPEMIVDKEAAMTLYLITSILTELWTMTTRGDAEYGHDVLQKWFRETFAKDFYQFYLTDFPHRFQQFDARQQDIQMNPIALNVSIAHLFCQLTQQLRKEETVEFCGNVLDLVIKTVNQKLKHLDEFTVDLLMRTITCTVLERLDLWKRAGNGSILKKIKHLISCLVKAAITLGNRATKEKVAVFLSEVILHNDVYSTLEDVLQEWVVHLPQTLLQPEISVQLMNTLLRLGTHKNIQFLDGIRLKRTQISGNLKTVAIPDSVNETADRRKLTGILFWIE